MQTLQDALRFVSQLETPSQRPGSAHFGTGYPLINERIFYIAPTDMINEVASTLTAFIFEGIRRDQKGSVDRTSWDIMKARASEVIDILFGEAPHVKSEFSRTLVCIASKVRDIISSEDRTLGAVFVRRLADYTTAELKDVWRKVTAYAERNRDFVKLLETRTAIWSDLHAKMLSSCFCQALDDILPKATTADLFDILLFVFVSRGNSDVGLKLRGTSWTAIVKQFDKIPKAQWGSLYEGVREVIDMFQEDAGSFEYECRVPFQEVQDFQSRELKELCDSIRRIVLGEVGEEEEEKAFAMAMRIEIPCQPSYADISVVY